MNKAFDDGWHAIWLCLSYVGRATVYPVSSGEVCFRYLFFFRISLHGLRTFTFGLTLVVGICHRHWCLFGGLVGGIYRLYNYISNCY